MAHTLNVEELKRTTPQHVFEQWRAYWKMKRWGDEWEQTAQLTAAVLRSQEMFTKFMPDYKPPAGSSDGIDPIEKTTQILNAFLAVYQG